VLPENASEFVNNYLVKGEIPQKHLLYQYGSSFIYPVETAVIADIKT
jgi:hypothetical protein